MQTNVNALLDQFVVANSVDIGPSGGADSNTIQWLGEQGYRVVNSGCPVKYADAHERLPESKHFVYSRLPPDLFREFVRYLDGTEFGAHNQSYPAPPDGRRRAGPAQQGANRTPPPAGEERANARRSKRSVEDDGADDGGRWSEAQDNRLRQVVDRVGRKWNLVSRDMNRSARACRERYMQLFPNMFDKEHWIPSDDFRLWHAHYTLNANWAKMVQLFPRRTAADIKARWLLVREVLPGAQDPIRLWKAVIAFHSRLGGGGDWPNWTDDEIIAQSRSLTQDIERLQRDEARFLSEAPGTGRGGKRKTSADDDSEGGGSLSGSEGEESSESAPLGCGVLVSSGLNLREERNHFEGDSMDVAVDLMMPTPGAMGSRLSSRRQFPLGTSVLDASEVCRGDRQGSGALLGSGAATPPSTLLGVAPTPLAQLGSTTGMHLHHSHSLPVSTLITSRPTAQFADGDYMSHLPLSGDLPSTRHHGDMAAITPGAPHMSVNTPAHSSMSPLFGARSHGGWPNTDAETPTYGLFGNGT